jgi:fermentation-respiration switch protein FrsA (DUF1100 family)
VRRVLGLLAAFAILAGATVAALVVTQQRRILYPLRRAPDATALLRAVGGERVWLEREGVRSEAWFLPARGAAPGGRAPLLVFTHGNAELIDDWAREFDEPRSWGAAALLVEYPGYGRSGGDPSEKSISNAIVAAYDWAAARPDVDPRRIVAYGRSLGGGAACALARERELAALVLESSFTSVRALASVLGVPGFLVLDPFDNESCVAAFRKPLLLIHGEQDEIVPVAESRALHAAAPHSELLVLGDCGHNDCPRPWPKLFEFLTSHKLL